MKTRKELLEDHPGYQHYRGGPGFVTFSDQYILNEAEKAHMPKGSKVLGWQLHMEFATCSVSLIVHYVTKDEPESVKTTNVAI